MDNDDKLEDSDCLPPPQARYNTLPITANECACALRTCARSSSINECHSKDITVVYKNVPCVSNSLISNSIFFLYVEEANYNTYFLYYLPLSRCDSMRGADWLILVLGT